MKFKPPVSLPTGDHRDDIPEPDLLPCGCLLTYSIEEGVPTMTASPCRPDCEQILWLRREVEQQGKPIVEREA